MSSSMHVDNKKDYILILGEGSTFFFFFLYIVQKWNKKSRF